MAKNLQTLSKGAKHRQAKPRGKNLSEQFYKVGILKLRFVQFLGMAPHTAKA